MSVDDRTRYSPTVDWRRDDAGDLVGFYTDANGNTDGMLALPSI